MRRLVAVAEPSGTVGSVHAEVHAEPRAEVPPPESFVMSSVVAHVLTYSAHRRQVVRRLLAAAGRDVDDGDPIMWLRAQRGETA